MSFATGFFNAGSAILDENQQYIKTKRAKDRDFLMTYGVQAVTGAKSKVNKYVTTGMQLESMGLTKDNINFIVDTSGPQGLASLYSRVKDYRPDQLSADVFNNMVERTAEYKPSGSSYEDSIGKAFGLYKANVTDDPAENEKISFWAALGFDPKAADSALDEQYIGGYTGRDIKRIMGTAAPSMLAPLSVDFSALPILHSPTTLEKYAQSTFKRIELEAVTNLSLMAPTGQAALENLGAGTDAYKRYQELELAISKDDYATMVRLVPTIKSKILDYNDLTGGGLLNNPVFNIELPDFFAEQKIAKQDLIVKKRARAIKLFEGMGSIVVPPIDELNSYETEAEAEASGDNFFLLNGMFASFLPEPVGPNAKPNKIQNVGGSIFPAEDLSKVSDLDLMDPTLAAAEAPTVAVEDNFTSQIEGIVVPDSDRNQSNYNYLTGKYTNPVVDQWYTLTQDYLDKDFTFEGQTKAQINRFGRSAYNNARQPIEDLLEEITDYLLADAEGGSEEALRKLSEELGANINSQSEDVQSLVADLLNKFEGKEVTTGVANAVAMGGPVAVADAAVADAAVADAAVADAAVTNAAVTNAAVTNAAVTNAAEVKPIVEPIVEPIVTEEIVKTSSDDVDLVDKYSMERMLKNNEPLGEGFNPRGKDYRNPALVIANGFMPFTELVEVPVAPDDAINIQSYDTLKARLRDGTIKQGDVVTGLRGKNAYLIDHSGFGDVGRLSTIKFQQVMSSLRPEARPAEQPPNVQTETPGLMTPTTGGSGAPNTISQAVPEGLSEALLMYQEVLRKPDLEREPAQGAGRPPKNRGLGNPFGNSADRAADANRRNPSRKALYTDIFLKALQTKPLAFETKEEALAWIESSFPESPFSVAEKGRAAAVLYERFGTVQVGEL